MCELNINDMTLEQKIGHLLVARGFIDEEDKQFIYEMVDKKAVGGIQMSFAKGDTRYEFAQEVKRRADYPILVSGDMERGYPAGKVGFTGAPGIASCGNPEIAYELGRITAIEAKNDGVSVAWGPVADLSLEKAICKNPRCFSDNPSVVSEYVTAMIKGLQDEGMIVTLKHFPGGSDVVCDTHMQIGVSELTEEELIERDLVPYLNAMKNANLSGIMTGHILFKNIDDKYIASLSEKVIGIIRKLGFDGLIVTDSLAMMAVVQNYGMKEALGLAVAAGNDMVLPDYRLSFKESFEALMNAYKNKAFSEERLNEAVARVLKAQHMSLKAPTQKELTKEQLELADSVNKKSICAVLKEGFDTKIPENNKKLFVLFCENTFAEERKDIHEINFESPTSRACVNLKAERLLEEFPGSEAYVINEFPCQTEMEEVFVKLARADEAVFFTFSRAGAYLGSDGITDRAKNLINACAGKTSAVVHTGNLYEIKRLENIKRIITSIISDDEYIIKILKGEAKAEGVIPITL